MIQPVLSPADAQLAHLIQVAWILLIPVGLLLALVLYKVVSLLSVALELSTMARYEIYPTLKNVHRISDRLDAMSAKVSDGVDTVGKALEKVKPAFEKGAEGFKTGTEKAKSAGSTLFNGLWQVIRKRL